MKIDRLHRACGALLMAAAVAVAGTASTRAADFTPLPKGETRTVTVGVGGSEPDLSYLPIWVAEYGGYFDALKQDGIIVKVVPFTGGGADAVLALATGKTNVSYQSFENAVRARAQGRDLTYIYNAILGPTEYIVVRNDLVGTIKTPADAGGKRWGVTGFGAASHQEALRVARFYGVDPGTIQYLALGGHDGMAPALREKRVDIVSTSVPLRNRLENEGLATDLLNLNDPVIVRKVMGHDYIGLGLLSTASWTNANPYVAFKVVEAIQHAVDTIKAGPPERIAKLLPAQFEGPVEVSSIAALTPAFSPTGVTSGAAVKAMIDDLADLKLTKTSMDLMGVMDNRFVEAAPPAK